MRFEQYIFRFHLLSVYWQRLIHITPLPWFFSVGMGLLLPAIVFVLRPIVFSSMGPLRWTRCMAVLVGMDRETFPELHILISCHELWIICPGILKFLVLWFLSSFLLPIIHEFFRVSCSWGPLASLVIYSIFWFPSLGYSLLLILRRESW